MSSRRGNAKLGTTGILLILLLALGALWYLGYLPTLRPQTTIPSPPEKPTEPTQPTYPAAALQFSIKDAITDSSITSSNTKVDICKVSPDGVVDFMTKYESITVDSDPEQSTMTYAQGDILIIHVSCDVDPTGGTDYYDAWYYVKLEPGEPLRIFRPELLTPIQTSPTYKYKFIADGEPTQYVVQRVKTSSGGEYWGIGALKVYPRVSSANLDTYAEYGGTVLSSVTDGSTWDTTANKSATADATLASTNEIVKIKLVAGATNLCYGLPMYTISSNGQIQTRKAFVIVATDMTSIGVQELLDEGWKVLSDSTLTSEKAFYKEITPAIPPYKGKKFNDIVINFPVDCSAAASGTKYVFKVWIIDFQLEDNLKIGSVSTTVPTAYGFIGEYGLDSMIHPRAYSTSSGASTNSVLAFVLQTP